jgi:methyl coenzyme M reductase subunit C-like uncharacterized protein (methanogenesis marker protein 7)
MREPEAGITGLSKHMRYQSVGKQLKQDFMMVPPDTFFMSKIDSQSPNVTDIESPAGIILQTHEDVVL